jgi:hypothetical protein
MSQGDIQRHHLLRSVLEGSVTLTAAATALGISVRQAWWLKGAVVAVAGCIPAMPVPL